jgi:hypothetical protein
MKPVYTPGVSRLHARFLRRRSQALLFVLVSVTGLLGTLRLRAEGTKQVMTNPNNGTGLIVSTTSSFPLGNVGPYLGAPVDQRIYIHIKDFTTEMLYYGFNWETLSPSTPISTYSDVYMNLFDPTGALVPGYPQLLPTSGAGFISTYINAIQGPIIGGVPSTGYSPLTYTPNQNGDYYVTFYRSSDGGKTHISNGESMLAKYFDLTVSAGGSHQNGRVHCNEWAFSVYNPKSSDIQDPLSPTNAQFYAYTPDSVTLKVSFPSTGGFQPLSFIVSFNSFGVANNGDWINDRKSIVLPHLAAPYLQGGFPVFLTDPDNTVYPTCAIPNPPILLAPVIYGCPPGPYNVRFFAPQAGDYYMLFDLNGVPGYQANSSDRFIELVNQVPGIVTYVWDGLDGLKNIVPANVTFPIDFSYRKGRINLPFYDVELNIKGFTVDGVAPAGAVSANTTLYWDDTQLTNRGSINDCSDNNNNYTGVGYDNSIVGVKPTATLGRAWDGDGNKNNLIPAPSVKYSGTANDQDNVQCNDYGNARLLNTWAWGIVLDTKDTVTLSCIAISGKVWDDADGSANGGFTNINTNSEKGTNAVNGLYASLVDPVTSKVISTAPVNANGTYNLLNCPVFTNGMQVYLTNTPATAGNAVPAAGIPSDWTNTSPIIRVFNSADSNVNGLDFGIEQLPNSVDQNYTIESPVLNTMVPLNGSGTISSPGPLIGSDPEDGALGSGKKVMITAVPSNEELYYNNVLLADGAVISNYTPSLLQVKFTSITVTSTSFNYAYIDAAGKADSTPATYTINMSVTLASTLGSFSGRNTDLGNVLSWTAYTELPGSSFTIERSANGTGFAAIGTVAAAGNNTTVSHAYTDASPVPNTANYYRLEYTDGNGSVAYSNVVTIGAFSGSAVMDVSPNPFTSEVNVRLNLASAERVSIRLLDAKGMLLKQAQYQGAKGVNAFEIDGLSVLPPSVYFVQIVLADQAFVRKVFNR